MSLETVSSQTSLQIPELLAPAGNWDCAKAAVENGADAIYFGLEKFNARMRADNFTEADLPELMSFLHERGVKGYVTLNTLIFPQELREAQQYLKSIISAGVDAVIVQDIGICRLIRHLSPDFPIHASTQMTITTAEGVEFAQDLGCNLVVLARECSIQEINKIQEITRFKNFSLPLEVFVHGALCVAYSGQCLTSEALGGRSANRGECAQACRMTYDLICDDDLIDLGDRKYLLSPQDLYGLEVLPDLIKSGVASLKIEGRLKTPEYVANVTRVYRKALDQINNVNRENSAEIVSENTVTDEDIYNLEMAFSRGLYTGWFDGINNQELVHARFGKKRGVYLGRVVKISGNKVTINLKAPLKPGDGIVFDSGHPEYPEQGGRIYTVDIYKDEAILTFGRDDIDLHKVYVGDWVWKTNDPELDKQLRQSFNTDIPQFQRAINMEVFGDLGRELVAIARDHLGNIVEVKSEILLTEARTKPLTTDVLKAQLGRLGNTPFSLGDLTNHLQGDLMLPISELNKVRREIVAKLKELRSRPKKWRLKSNSSLKDLLPKVPTQIPATSSNLIVLVRNIEQLERVIKAGIETIYCDFADVNKYQEAVKLFREQKISEKQTIWVAPPRITKTGENWILQQVINSNADGYLIRNYDHIKYFAGKPCIGDFSFNVANALTAEYLHNLGLERITASYDLNINQLQDLLITCPPDWLEVTIHQHIPMFHMEHCVFCAFLSTGVDYKDCGRPCDKHQVKLRDRVGTEHILQADAGCRNTLFNGKAQTGAEYVDKLRELGLKNLRIELLEETGTEIDQIIKMYQRLLRGEISGQKLWRDLRLQNQLGVTRGSLK
jgi:U32 family peptidase